MSTFLKLLAVLAPAAAIVLAMPVAFGPFYGDPRGFFGPYFLMALPVWLAVLTAPGYLVTLFADPATWSHSRLARWWVLSSLAVSALCSLVGVVASSMMFLFLPPSLLSFIIALILLRRAVHSVRVSRSSVRPVRPDRG